jgi:hypothetical protein
MGRYPVMVMASTVVIFPLRKHEPVGKPGNIKNQKNWVFVPVNVGLYVSHYPCKNF